MRDGQGEGAADHDPRDQEGDRQDTCDNGEAFEDANKNGSWDKDTGNAGFGSARDAVLYTVTVSYNRLFPIAAFIPGQTKNFSMSATNVLRNQPYGSSGKKMAPGTGNCT